MDQVQVLCDWKQIEDGHAWQRQAMKDLLGGKITAEADFMATVVNINIMANTFYSVLADIKAKGLYWNEPKQPETGTYEG